MLKRILRLGLCVCMIMCVLPVVRAVAWGGIAISQPSGAGTENDPYQIASAAELAWFADQVSQGKPAAAQHARLIDAIDLGAEKVWTPIGTEQHEFIGVFDGGGHTVSGLYFPASCDTAIGSHYLGLFGHVGEGGVVRNVRVTGSVTGENHIAGVVGYNSGTVQNCSNQAVISGCSATSQEDVGGIVGYNNGVVENCSNFGAVGGTGVSVGGIVGHNVSSGTVRACYNTASVGATGRYVGGVVGYNQFGQIENCYNTGSVSAVSEATAGGIVGYCRITECMPGSVRYCFNTGTISCDGASGGIAGTNKGVIQFCYWLEGTGIGSDSGTVSDCSCFSSASVLISVGEKSVSLCDALNGSQTPAVWTVEETMNSGYPILLFQKNEAAAPAPAPEPETPSHQHCDCGAAACQTHTDKDRNWTAWSQADALPTAAGTYYLTTDVVLSDTWTVPGRTRLCLNGHVIRLTKEVQSGVIRVGVDCLLTLTDCADTEHAFVTASDGTWQLTQESTAAAHTLEGGVVTGGNNSGVSVCGGTFAMYGGNLVGNTADRGGGVYVYGASTFQMYGGRIVGNRAQHGGGVYVDAEFGMGGGEIRSNTAALGGGVYVNRADGMTVSGDVRVVENTGSADGAPPSNVYLGSGYMIKGTLGASGALGVTTEQDPTWNESVPVMKAAAESQGQITSDDANCQIVRENSALVMRLKHLCTFDQERIDPHYMASLGDCRTPKQYYMSCLCGARGTATFSAAVFGEHFLQYTPARPATATETGLQAHYRCTICGAVFDENQKAADPADLLIPMLHVHTQDLTVQYGDQTYWFCDSCGEWLCAGAVTMLPGGLPDAVGTDNPAVAYRIVAAYDNAGKLAELRFAAGNLCSLEPAAEHAVYRVFFLRSDFGPVYHALTFTPSRGTVSGGRQQ